MLSRELCKYPNKQNISKTKNERCSFLQKEQEDLFNLSCLGSRTAGFGFFQHLFPTRLSRCLIVECFFFFHITSFSRCSQLAKIPHLLLPGHSSCSIQSSSWGSQLWASSLHLLARFTSRNLGSEVYGKFLVRLAADIFISKCVIAGKWLRIFETILWGHRHAEILPEWLLRNYTYFSRQKSGRKICFYYLACWTVNIQTEGNNYAAINGSVCDAAGKLLKISETIPWGHQQAAILRVYYWIITPVYLVEKVGKICVYDDLTCWTVIKIQTEWNNYAAAVSSFRRTSRTPTATPRRTTTTTTTPRRSNWHVS